jgi:ABC-type bacteriocin/lantibiotic exporter with double-glycine peptidase domain
MQRTDFITTFLSGLSFIIVAPLLVILFIQWWFVAIIGVIIFAISAWIFISNKKTHEENHYKSKTDTPQSLSPEVLLAIRETLSAPFCSQCGAKFQNSFDSFCVQCGEERTLRPLNALLDVSID